MDAFVQFQAAQNVSGSSHSGSSSASSKSNPSQASVTSNSSLLARKKPFARSTESVSSACSSSQSSSHKSSHQQSSDKRKEICSLESSETSSKDASKRTSSRTTIPGAGLKQNQESHSSISSTIQTPASTTHSRAAKEVQESVTTELSKSSESHSTNQDTSGPQSQQFSNSSCSEFTPPPLQQKQFFTTLDWSDTSQSPSESAPPQPAQPTSKLSSEILHKASILRHQFNTLPVIVFNTRHIFQPSNQKPTISNTTQQLPPPRQGNNNPLSRQSRRHKSALSTLETLMAAGIESATLFPIIVTDPFNLPSSKHATNETFTNDATTASDVLTMDWIMNPIVPPTVHQPPSNFFETMRNLHLFGNVDKEMAARDRLITFHRGLGNEGFEVGGGGVSHVYSLHRVLCVAPPVATVQKPVQPVDVWEDPHFVYNRLRHSAPTVPKVELLLKHFAHAPLDAEMRGGARYPHMFYATVAEWLWRQLRGDGVPVGKNGGMRGIGVASDVEQARIGFALRNRKLWEALSRGVSSPHSNVLERNAAGRLLMLLVERYGICRRGFWKYCAGVRWLVNTVETLIQTAIRLEGLQHWSTRLEKGLLEEKIRLLCVAGGMLALFLECGKDEINSPLNKSIKDKLVAHVFAAISECCILAAAMEEICEAAVTLVASLVQLLPTKHDQESIPMRDWTLLQNMASKFPSQKCRNTAVFVLRKLNIFDLKAGVNGTWTVARSWQEACQTNKIHPCMLSFNRIEYSH
ncbi:hypothetical protein BJ741DRAFT_142586 [Chytriomyces cf. hyalinus JEL632]|nr:hypothetical protein BJ741DRAFT_142586 [Chytriomyces cf. hyalinus JEL632]